MKASIQKALKNPWLAFCLLSFSLTLQACPGWLSRAAGFGTTCTSDSDCLPGEVCIRDECVDPDLTCFSDTDCAVDERCENGLCRSVGKRGRGEDCSAGGGEACASGVCLFTVGEAYCTEPCLEDENCVQAGIEWLCLDIGGKYCVRSGTRLETDGGCQCGGLGDDCTIHGDDDCLPGHSCVIHQGFGTTLPFCSLPCTPELGCPEGWDCQKEAMGSGLFCVPGGGGDFGQDCSATGQLGCDGGPCLSMEAGQSRRCSIECQIDDPCPEEWSCVSFPDDQSYCVFGIGFGGDGGVESGGSCVDGGSADCAGGAECVSWGTAEQAYCSSACDGGCPSGMSCEPTQARCRLGAFEGRTGASCSEGEAACDPGYFCISEGLGDPLAICSEPCSREPDSCPPRFRCASTASLGGAYLCHPALWRIPEVPVGQIGDECGSINDCTTGICASDADGKTFCTKQCFAAEDCPDEYPCQELGDTGYEICAAPGFTPPFRR